MSSEAEILKVLKVTSDTVRGNAMTACAGSIDWAIAELEKGDKRLVKNIKEMWGVYSTEEHYGGYLIGLYFNEWEAKNHYASLLKNLPQRYRENTGDGFEWGKVKVGMIEDKVKRWKEHEERLKEYAKTH